MGKIPWRKAWQPTPVFLPGESQGERSLVSQSWTQLKRPSMVEICVQTQTVQLQLCSCQLLLKRVDYWRKVQISSVSCPHHPNNGPYHRQWKVKVHTKIHMESWGCLFACSIILIPPPAARQNTWSCHQTLKHWLIPILTSPLHCPLAQGKDLFLHITSFLF